MILTNFVSIFPFIHYKFREICRNTNFLQPVYSLIRIKFTILSLYGNIRSEKTCILAYFNSKVGTLVQNGLTLSCRRSLSYRNQSIDFLCKSMYRFLYDRDLHHERVKGALCFIIAKMKQEKHLYLQEKMRNEKKTN